MVFLLNNNYLAERIISSQNEIKGKGMTQAIIENHFQNMFMSH